MTAETPTQRALALAYSAEAGDSDHALALLSGTAVAVGHGLDIDSLLADVATGVRRSLDADRVSVLLFDEAMRLTPAVAVARQHDESLWQRFRHMPPITLADLEGAQEALDDARVLVIDDARTSPLVPGAWQQAFHLESLAIAPVFVRDAPAGILVVELPATAVPVSSSRLSLLEGMAALTGVALHGLRRHDAVRRTDRLRASIGAINAARSPRAIAEHALDALLESCALTDGLVGLLSADFVDVAAVRGGGLPEPGGYPLDAVPQAVLDACQLAWLDGMRRPVEVVADGRAVTVIPMTSFGRISAIAALPGLLASLSPVTASEIQLIANVAGSALRASYLSSERDWRQRAVDIDASLDALPSAAHAVSLVRGFLADGGITLGEVALDRTTARCTGLSAATGAAARQLSKWRRTTEAIGPVRIGNEFAMPIFGNDRVVGVMLIGTLRDGVRQDVAVRLISKAISRDVARRDTVELERLTAESEAQASVAAQCYRDAAKSLGLLADQLNGSQLPDARKLASARVLLDQSRRLVRDAAQSLDTPSRAIQLRAALTETADRVFGQGGPEVTVRQSGRQLILETPVRLGILRAVRRLLTLLREVAVPVAVAHIDWADSAVTVTLRADQMSAIKAHSGTSLHAALRDARAWLGPSGGEVEVIAGSDGAAFEITAPIGLHRSERSTPVRPAEENREEVMPIQSARPSSV